jgi:hypothetical protein
MQILLPALLWAALHLANCAPYRPVPLLDHVGDLTAHIQAYEDHAKALRGAGKAEEAQKYEKAVELLRQRERELRDK